MKGEGLAHFIMRSVKDCLWLSCQPWVLDYSLSHVDIAIEQAVEMNVFFMNFSALSCVVQVETEEDSLSQAAFNQLEDKLK